MDNNGPHHLIFDKSIAIGLLSVIIGKGQIPVLAGWVVYAKIGGLATGNHSKAVRNDISSCCAVEKV